MSANYRIDAFGLGRGFKFVCMRCGWSVIVTNREACDELERHEKTCPKSGQPLITPQVLSPLDQGVMRVAGALEGLLALALNASERDERAEERPSPLVCITCGGATICDPRYGEHVRVSR